MRGAAGTALLLVAFSCLAFAQKADTSQPPPILSDAGRYAAARHGGPYMWNYYIPPAPGTTPWAPCWSPDGKRIAVAMQGSIWIVDPADRRSRRDHENQRLCLLANLVAGRKVDRLHRRLRPPAHSTGSSRGVQRGFPRAHQRRRDLPGPGVFAGRQRNSPTYRPCLTVTSISTCAQFTTAGGAASPLRLPRTPPIRATGSTLANGICTPSPPGLRTVRNWSSSGIATLLSARAISGGRRP